ncbi:2OG-Fe(II) oxygenase [Aurantiacibacter sp. MUD61]|uniref:2OG-Fe(II) oxygenase n=1 Tax=Aurantiacibacter sp. MUD61 TaxID=3009083 RepID=UPI0022F0F992|nr:2OG-Fe(II) oxygenase [Aurantiacibacter sp. MUD61]
MTFPPTSSLPPLFIKGDWLPESLCTRLFEESLASENDYVEAKVAYNRKRGILKPSIVEPRIRQASKRKLPGEWTKIFADRVLAEKDDIAEALGFRFPAQPHFQVEAVHTGDGGRFDIHIDTLRGREKARVITGVYYYSRAPLPFTGGELNLFSLDRRSSRGVAPTRNSIVFFSSIFPHEIAPVRVPTGEFADGRFSVNIWLSV